MSDIGRFTRRAVLTVLATLTAALVFAASALAAGTMTLTFVRHAESQANYDGVIDTSVPGPHLTATGQAQAEAIAQALSGNNYDGIYVSDMYRTAETAAPLAALLGKTPTVLPGLHEIDAGIYEGASTETGLGRLGYALTPGAWTLGARFVPMPGSTDPDGNAFDARVDAAVQTIYDSGDTNAVAFSHGATIMFWTLMNVDNPDLSLLLSHTLGNTGVVVVNGNPQDGWTLVSWDGVAVDPDPSFGTKLFVHVRDLVTTPQTAAYAVGRALADGDLAAAARAFVKGAIDVVLSPVKFVGAVISDVVDLFHPTVQPVAPDRSAVAVAPAAPMPSKAERRLHVLDRAAPTAAAPVLGRRGTEPGPGTGISERETPERKTGDLAARKRVHRDAVAGPDHTEVTTDKPAANDHDRRAVKTPRHNANRDAA